ncbi:glutathione S-transferase family protein [Neisseria chenwenguii]|uniref:glutathione transferase n=1 Tax=Neisseria chenwenguii TaxID=1853278 RepID=A0A220RZF2_9NEIS|nr:glutathione S-transferase [Neisseria chenwenguii]ASK26567.1 glutathione S-transferase [Neisseria chenwenguii]ROV56013.1 glutathione S-transferase [Neisseria chenwenguii]
MIKLHYLNNSCSHRIAWLLEELGLDYEIAVYHRLPETSLAPEELKRQHPLGKAPVLEDGSLKLAEGNAIIQHLLDRYDDANRFTPPSKTDDYSNYVYWLSVAASMFSANLLGMFSKRFDFGDYTAYAAGQVALYFNHVEQNLQGKTWLIGEQLTGADFAMSFLLQWGLNQVNAADYPNIVRYVQQIESRPAYQRVAEKTGCEFTMKRF